MPSRAQLNRLLRDGCDIDGKQVVPTGIAMEDSDPYGKPKLRIVLNEGRNREVRVLGVGGWVWVGWVWVYWVVCVGVLGGVWTYVHVTVMMFTHEIIFTHEMMFTCTQVYFLQHPVYLFYNTQCTFFTTHRCEG